MPLLVHVFGSRWPITGSASPACLKLLTWLRMAGIDHEVEVLRSGPRSKTGKVPYVTTETGEIVDDSEVIIAQLTEAHGVALDAGRTAHERALMRVIRNTVDKSLYFTTLLRRWDEGWDETKHAYFDDMMPGVVLALAGFMIRRGPLQQARGQGYGLRSREEVYAEALRDLEALEAMLGTDDWYFGSPGLTDALVFGTTENIAGCPLEWTPRTRVLEGPLGAHRQRVLDRWWSA
ncbi:MAG: hypothetical protein H6737_30665 [Alphaproteobacteria bacterium]|nr:hypothetical protein [Alphaproteobacteria bacterium]